EEVDDGELAGDDAGREDAAGGDEGTATKVVVFAPRVGVGMNEVWEVYVRIRDDVSNNFTKLRIRNGHGNGKGLLPPVKIFHSAENGKAVDDTAFLHAVVIIALQFPQRLSPVDLRDHQGNLAAQATSAVDGERCLRYQFVT